MAKNKCANLRRGSASFFSARFLLVAILSLALTGIVAPVVQAAGEISDKGLAKCITEQLELAEETPLTTTHLGELQELRCENQGIKSLAGLENAKNLTVLDLGGNKIADLTPLATLVNLAELALPNNQIWNLAPLDNLSKLTRANFAKNQIIDVTPLAGLTEVAELDLTDNQLTDLSPLQTNKYAKSFRAGSQHLNLVAYTAEPTELPMVKNRSGSVLTPSSPAGTKVAADQIVFDTAGVFDVSYADNQSGSNFAVTLVFTVADGPAMDTTPPSEMATEESPRVAAPGVATEEPPQVAATPATPPSPFVWGPRARIGWGWPTDPATGSFPVGDWNRAGHVDLMYINAEGKLFFYPVVGPNGRFGQRLQIGHGWTTMNIIRGGADFDGDGNPDLVARRASDNALVLYQGNGKNGFRGTRVIGNSWGGMRDFVVIPRSFGGKPAIMASDNAGVLYTYTTNGYARFTGKITMGTGWNNMDPILSAGDWNLDGYSDLLARDGAGYLWYYPAKANGALQGSRTLVGNGWNTMPIIMPISSVNGFQVVWAIDQGGNLYQYTNRNRSLPAATGPKRIDVNLSNFTISGWQGSRRVLGPTPIIAGAPGTPTKTGTFKVYSKYPSKTMSGRNLDGSRYVTPNVPWVMFYSGAYAIHGAYWRTSFGYDAGRNGSHGCVNLPVPAAKQFYNWAPIGTPVVIHR